MRCTGTVLDSATGIARVHIESKACDNCHACGFGAVRDEKSMDVNALNEVGAARGDSVHLEVSGRKVMNASAIVFLMPFGAFIAGFLLGYFLIGLWVSKTPAALITGVVFLAASYYLVHVFGNRMKFEFVIKEIVEDGEPASPGDSPDLV